MESFKRSSRKKWQSLHGGELSPDCSGLLRLLVCIFSFKKQTNKKTRWTYREDPRGKCGMEGQCSWTCPSSDCSDETVPWKNRHWQVFHTRTVSLHFWSVNLLHCDRERKSDGELQDWSYATVAQHINVVAWPALFPGSSKVRTYGLSPAAWQAAHVCPKVHRDTHCKHWLRQRRQIQLETLTEHRS